MRLPYEVHLALRYLRFHRGRTFLSIITLISVAGVAVGTAALVIALSLMTGFENDVRERILKGSAHLTVMSAAEPAFEGADALANRLEQVAGVAAAGPVLYTPAMISGSEGTTPAYAQIHGVNPERQGILTGLGGSGPSLFRALGENPNGIVLGSELAKNLRVERGDRVRVLLPRLRLTPFAPIPKSRTLEVVGVFRADAYPLDSERAYVALETARALLDAPGRAHWVELRLRDPSALGRMKEDLSRQLGSRWIVLDLLEQNRDLLKALNTEKLILFLAIGLIVIVAALNIVSTLILMVTDKVKEIGALTSMGARPAGIGLVFVVQGFVIGLVGTSLGLSVGSALAWWLDRYEVIRLDPDVYYISHVPFTMRGQDLAFVAALALAVSLLATIYPAWKAARLDPVEAIRHE
jgi:lipoprotein-releasing system permease protein